MGAEMLDGEVLHFFENSWQEDHIFGGLNEFAGIQQGVCEFSPMASTHCLSEGGVVGCS